VAEEALGREGVSRWSFDLPKWAYVQAALSLGDRRAASCSFSPRSRGQLVKAFTHSESIPDFFVHRPKEWMRSFRGISSITEFIKSTSSRSTSSLSGRGVRHLPCGGLHPLRLCADPPFSWVTFDSHLQHSRYFSAEVWALSLAGGKPENGVKHEPSRSIERGA